jgi:hypothetical protein
MSCAKELRRGLTFVDRGERDQLAEHIGQFGSLQKGGVRVHSCASD